ncbi:putative bifunctional diguanylate cyclase/phosphodiesterase [Vallicoccus soli]|uniref:EAL domain-containing protein n=1 Tax=Vallicoccus soli TaxID=2339232 RepID=A0A3A3YS79_9ACTN|nr:EAL domain-containing protein [Vallicoccus soli]RJK94201.1 EAL domain-containing protein [Vallicoccus soli]
MEPVPAPAPRAGLRLAAGALLAVLLTSAYAAACLAPATREHLRGGGSALVVVLTWCAAAGAAWAAGARTEGAARWPWRACSVTLLVGAASTGCWLAARALPEHLDVLPAVVGSFAVVPYACAMLVVFRLPRVGRSRVVLARAALDGVVGALAAGLLAWDDVPAGPPFDGEQFATYLTGLLMVAADLVLLGACLTSARLGVRRDRGVLLLGAVALVGISFADLMLAGAIARGPYAAADRDPLASAGYVLGGLLLVVVALASRWGSDLFRPITRTRGGAGGGVGAGATPAMTWVLVVSVIVEVLATGLGGGTLQPLELVMAVMLSAAVVLRLLLTGLEGREAALALERSASTDALTGLANRAAFVEALQGAAADHRVPGAVVFLDLDGFKEVNDLAGHDVGDRLLVEAAQRLRREVRGDVVARFGGDEFAVLLARAPEPAAAEVAARLVRALAAPYDVGGLRPVLSASAGVAVVAPGADPAEVLRDADLAMYRAKELGKDQAHVYHPDLHAAVVRRDEVARALREALEGDELELHYQPLATLGPGGEVVAVDAVEALVRWRRDGALVPPGEFVPVAEETGAVVALDRWVLRRACHQAARWRAAGTPVRVAVNLSALQLATGDLDDVVGAALAAARLPAELLALEVTESALLADEAQARETLARLRGRGVRVALDDFGTGFTSIGHLRRLPLDVLKVDRSYVQAYGADPQLSSLLRAIVRVGRDLGLDVVAEGVEDAALLPELARLGATHAQGWWYSRAVPAAEVPALLAPAPVGAARP